ncbi:hypothetical protein JL722_8130 [Aureococcus anophagefferens]|nr:hypothetical protein JL722_8130 [Aureococcus anophagefferens]
MDDEAPPVRRRVLAALAEDGAFEAGVLRDAATALRRRYSLAVSLMKALEDVSLEEGVLLGVAAKLRGTPRAAGAPAALLAAPLEKGMQAQRSTAVRRRAVDALGANGALSELRELVFSGDDDAGIRGEALHWMARLDDLDGICRRGFNDRNAELRASAARLLGDVAVRRSQGSTAQTADALAAATELPCGAPAMPERVDDVQYLPFDAVPRCGPWYGAAVDALRTAARGGNVGVRAAALAQLARLRAVPELAVGLSDAHAPTRLRVIAALGSLGAAEEHRCVAARRALASDGDAKNRGAALECLGSSATRRRRWTASRRATATSTTASGPSRPGEPRAGRRGDCPKLVVDALCASAGAVAALPAALRLAALRALRKQAGKYDGSARELGAALTAALDDADHADGRVAAADVSFGGFVDAPFKRDLARSVAARLRGRARPGGPRTPRTAARTSASCAPRRRALGALQEDDLAVDALHDALRLDREPLVKGRRAALGCLRHPRSLKPLLAPLRDKKDATLAEAARAALEGLDYAKLPAIKRDERVLLHGPIFKRKQKLWTQLKALVLTDAPRLFYVDADSLKCKDCDLRTLEGRVRVSLLFGLARDWTRAAGDALAALATPPSPRRRPPPPASYRASRRLDAPDDDGDGDDAARATRRRARGRRRRRRAAAGRRGATTGTPSSSPGQAIVDEGAPPIRDVGP